MIHSVEIAEDAYSAEHTPQNEGRPGFLWNMQRNQLRSPASFKDNDSGKNSGYQIAEEAFLHGWEIPRQADTDIHTCKAECRHEDCQNASDIIVLWFVVHFSNLLAFYL